ncbi:hypothetical protein MATL_G00123770 [Megalops atlanticus]|uniref:Uncharacterized protein n=1 Tax=Megalops atlanticus TaxID=7932 RepID=A0A9D3Q344_MEGAT|nr:hypothetical protein MATL_G00123770 [Megalops atlanticus]
MEGGQVRSSAPTYLAWSILNTICCCLPLGIAAIVYSSKANSANSVGDSATAQDASRTARNLNIAALVCGVILLIIIVVLQVLKSQQ